MCTVCGCGEGETRIKNGKHAHKHTHDHHHEHEHTHDHSHQHGHEHDHEHLHYGNGPARAHNPGMSQSKMIQIEADILGKNNGYAQQNRTYLQEHAILCLNLVSSPGSGKTTLLTRTLDKLQDELKLSVIEGDQETSNDADKIRATGVPAIQINTGKGCHLDAHQVGHAIEHLAPADESVLFIENVGNLVCPAAFDLGEAAKVAILSVTEGDDKPIKYPDMFHAADLVLINKLDLLPYVDFDMDKCKEYLNRVNPGVKTLALSATTLEGFDDWLAWVKLNQQLNKIGNQG